MDLAGEAGLGCKPFLTRHLDDSSQRPSDFLAENHEAADKSALHSNCSEQPPKKDDEDAEREGLERTAEPSPDVASSYRALEKHPISGPSEDSNLVSTLGHKCY